MTITDQIFRKVAETSIPHFFITVEFSASGTEMPEHIESVSYTHLTLPTTSRV